MHSSSSGSDYESEMSEGEGIKEENPAIIAAKTGNVSYLIDLINQDIPIHEITDSHGNTLLHLAIMNEQIDMVAFLLEDGVEVNKLNINQMAPLHFAVQKGNVILSKLLFDHKADVNIASNIGYRPLHVATLFQHFDVLMELLKAGASVDHIDQNVQTPLHLACTRDSIQIVEALLTYKATIDPVDKDNYTPMHCALINCKDTTVKMLQNFGSQIDPLQFSLDRELSTIFNNIDLYNILQEEYNLDFKLAGQPQESIRIMSKYIRQFIEMYPEDKECFELLLKVLDEYKEENTSPVTFPTSDLSMTLLSSFEHSAYALIKKVDDIYEIFYCDRGLLSFAAKEPDKVYSIIQLSIPKAYYIDVMSELISVCNSANIDEFKDFILKLKQDYKNTGINPTVQKEFKNENCFFENLKSFVLCFLISQTNNDIGKYLYKKLDEFMHRASFSTNQKESSASCRDNVDRLCNEILSVKNAKLSRYSITTFSAGLNSKRQNSEFPSAETQNKKSKTNKKTNG